MGRDFRRTASARRISRLGAHLISTYAFGLRGTEMQSDDIIVGAGSCGAALAARLSEDASFCSKLVPGYRTIKETPDDLLDRTISMATTAGA